MCSVNHSWVNPAHPTRGWNFWPIRAQITTSLTNQIFFHILRHCTLHLLTSWDLLGIVSNIICIVIIINIICIISNIISIIIIIIITIIIIMAIIMIIMMMIIMINIRNCFSFACSIFIFWAIFIYTSSLTSPSLS